MEYTHRPAALFTILALTTLSFSPAQAASPFEITHRGSGKRGFRLSALCNGGSGQSLGTVRVFQRSLFDRVGSAASPTPMQVALEDGQLVAVVRQYPADGKEFDLVVGDASDLDDVRLFPGVMIRMTKRSFIHPWTAHLEVTDPGQGTRPLSGERLDLPKVTKRLLDGLRSARPIDPESTRDVLVSMLEVSWENTPDADFSEDYFGTEADETYLSRMREYYVTPVKDALASLSPDARSAMAGIHSRVVAGARKAQQALLERLEYDRQNGGDVGHPNRLIRQRIMPVILGELDQLTAALGTR